MNKKLVMITLLLLSFVPMVAAQATGEAPEIVSITPQEALIVGGGRTTIEVEYDDADGDATTFIWDVAEGDESAWNLPDGFFAQALAGTTIPVNFRCADVDTNVTIQLIVADAQGNQSEPATFDLICLSSATAATIPESGQGGGTAADEATETDEEPAPDAVGSAPEIIAITPGQPVIRGGGVVTVEVEYADADEDATSFIWDVAESDSTDWVLPDGFFNQAAVGTIIPVDFRCTDEDSSVVIQLIVADAAGNESEPATLELFCLSSTTFVPG